jgi:hypothetical protein
MVKRRRFSKRQYRRTAETRHESKRNVSYDEGKWWNGGVQK